MRLLLWLVLCLSLAGLLTICVIRAGWWWMKRVARRVGLTEHQQSQKPIKGYLWLLDREMEQYLAERKREESE